MAKTLIDKNRRIALGIENKRLKDKLGYTCVYCGCTNRLMLTIDHIVPRVKGGDDTDENKQVCCFICNQLKGGLSHDEFVEYYESLQNLHDMNKMRLFMNRNPFMLKFLQWSHPGDVDMREDEEE